MTDEWDSHLPAFAQSPSSTLRSPLLPPPRSFPTGRCRPSQSLQRSLLPWQPLRPRGTVIDHLVADDADNPAAVGVLRVGGKNGEGTVPSGDICTTIPSVLQFERRREWKMNALWGFQILENPTEEDGWILIILVVRCWVAIFASRLKHSRSLSCVSINDDFRNGEDCAGPSNLRRCIISVHRPFCRTQQSIRCIMTE